MAQTQPTPEPTPGTTTAAAPDAAQAPMPELVFLGTGTSAGVPMIACDGDPPCACVSDDPRDRRDRASLLLRIPVTDVLGSGDKTEPDPDGNPNPDVNLEREPAASRHIVIDTGPEFRRQCLREKLMHLDAVLYTHAHADHILGLDDLRRFNAAMNAPIDIYAERPVLDTFGRMFTYIFEPHRNVNKTFVATLISHAVEPGEAFTLPHLPDLTITPLRLMHGRLPILGFRFDHPRPDGTTASAAYCTDTSTIPPETYPRLVNLDVLILDGLRHRHHPTHLSIDQALTIADEVAPGVTYLTHMAHDVIHADLEAELPDHVRPAYDGLRLPL